MITNNDWFMHDFDEITLDFIKSDKKKKFYEEEYHEVCPGILDTKAEVEFEHIHHWEIANFPVISQKFTTVSFWAVDHTNDRYLQKEATEKYNVFIRMIPGIYFAADTEQTREIIQFEISARWYKRDAPLEFKLVFMNSNFEEFELSKKNSYEAEHVEQKTELSKVKSVRWVYRDELTEALKGNRHATIFVYVKQTVTLETQKVFMSEPDDENRLEMEMANHFHDFYNSRVGSDFEIVTPRATLPVHKFFLSVHSEYFTALTTLPMMERSKGKVWLNENHDLLFELVTFIYTMSCPNIFWLLQDLHIAAKRFSIDSLLKLTQQEIPSAINVMNVLPYFVMSHRCGFEEYLDQCKYLIGKRKRRILKTTQYEVMIERFPDVIEDFYEIVDLDLVKLTMHGHGLDVPVQGCSNMADEESPSNENEENEDEEDEHSEVESEQESDDGGSFSDFADLDDLLAQLDENEE